MKYKEVIITGASSGIGEALAKKYLRSGASVYALSRSRTRLTIVKNKLPKKLQKNFYVYKCDVSDNSQVKVVINRVFKDANPDLVINNAGIGYSERLTKLTDKQISQIIGTNLKGTIYVTKESLRARKKNRPLHIVNVTSLGGKIGFPKLSIYSASKFAVEGFTESVRRDHKDENVYFTILRPGITDTNFFDKANMKDFKDKVKNLKSFYSPDKVADLFIKELNINKKEITIGNDKVFLRLMPFVPFKYRFKLLDIVNKI